MAGFTLWWTLAPDGLRQRLAGWRGAAAVLALSLLPDADFIPGMLIGDAGRWHHAGTHSLAFALAVSCCLFAAFVVTTGHRHLAAQAALAAGMLLVAHLALDLVTDDTREPYGMQLLWPFSREYYLSPVALLERVYRGPLDAYFLRRWAVMLGREALLLGGPFLLAWAWRRHGSHGKRPRREG